MLRALRSANWIMVAVGLLLPFAWHFYHRGRESFELEFGGLPVAGLIMLALWASLPYVAVAVIQYGLRQPEGALVLLVFAIAMAILQWLALTDTAHAAALLTLILPVPSLAFVSLGFLVAIWVQKVTGEL